jgi:hypothetical protein
MNKTNLFIDLSILPAFLVISEPRITGFTIHEWLGVAFTAAIVVHILLHWKWIVEVGARYFKKVFQISRLKFVVDLLLFAAMTAVIMSGILISKSFLSALGIQLSVDHSWKMIHSLSANAALWMVGLHFALNWKWVVSMTKKYILSPVFSLASGRQKKSAAFPINVSK